ncbi:MAG TPA: argininosuccinate lyase [Fibrobacteria bacterium]|nr:argininosuccinate lyase [Fibrobacteria bacterium]
MAGKGEARTGKSMRGAKAPKAEKTGKAGKAGRTGDKLWQGRFQGGMASSMERLSISLSFDRKLFREDIEGSMAHAKGLRASGVLSETELKRMLAGLKGVMADLEKGADLFEPGDEDIHMAVERILTARIGALGRKLHTGRSRNDQVATDLKLYVRRRAEALEAKITALQTAIHRKAVEYQGALMPGYTHVQQAQPIYISHYLLSFFFALERDKARLRQVRASAAEMPLGSGALAGSAFPYRRELVAKELGFPAVSANSIDATAHRDWALEFLGAMAILGATLSGYAEDMVLWSTQEYGYVELGEAYTSGSSMMPQKKNPDSMELIRGKAGRLLGNFTRLFAVLKGLPHAYDRDLQEDKEPVFDSVETLEITLAVMAEAIGSLKFDLDAIRRKMHPGMLATDLADYLVEKGVPFRDAHHVVGRMVARAEALKTSFLDLPEEDWKDIPDGRAFRKRLTFAYSAERRNIQGGTGSASVKAQLAKARRILGP